jgi:hypothetical protein
MWGPNMWNKLHTFTFLYPDDPTEKEKSHVINYFNNLDIPCKKCQKNYKRKLLQNPVEFHVENKESLEKWLINIHNTVNLDTGKEYIPYKEAMYKQESINNLWIGVPLVILILLIIIKK